MNNKLKVSQQHVSSQFSLESIFSDLVLQLVNFEPLGGAKTDPRGKKKKPWPPTSRTWHVLHVTLAKHSGRMMSDLERWGLASWITRPQRPFPQKMIPFCAALGVWFSIYATYGTVYMLFPIIPCKKETCNRKWTQIRPTSFIKRIYLGFLPCKYSKSFEPEAVYVRKISLSQNLSEISQVKWFNNQIILMNTHINIWKICGQLARKSFYRFSVLILLLYLHRAIIIVCLICTACLREYSFVAHYFNFHL